VGFLELFEKRRSVRSFKPDPVEDDKLTQVLEAARLAPSACNLQPWTFLVVRDQARRQQLKAAYDRKWFSTAPVVIAVCSHPSVAWKRRYDGKNHSDVDVAIAGEHMVLAAAELGLGTCWVCAFEPSVARKALEVPEDVEIVALLPLGYPAEEGAPSSRKPLEAIVRWDRWSA